MAKTITTKEFADIVGTTDQELTRLKREGILKTEAHGLWEETQVAVYCVHLRSVIRSQAGKLRAQAKKDFNDSVGGGSSKDSADADYRKQKARIARYQADTMAGNLVRIDAVEKFLKGIIFRAKTRLFTVPDEVASVIRPHLVDGVGPGEMKQLVKDRIMEACDELASSYRPETDEAAGVQAGSEDVEGLGDEDSGPDS